MHRMLSHARSSKLCGSASAVATASAANAQKKYDPGATDTEIKIGNIMPYSGPASAYATIGKTEAAYFNKLNAEGGINGRKINFISYDDGYSPPKTVEQARKLVESDEVLLIFNPLGTPGNTAIQKYMNAKKVPQIFVSTGAAKWNDPKNFPWTMGWQPNYQTEARIYAAYILKNHPGKTIGVLYQNDDFGKDYIIGLRDTFSLDERGMQRLFTQFSFPGGIPSHVAPETPGSIHEGGELGYSLSHAYGAALDNPDLVVACVIGDGEAETGPLAASWHTNKFLDPVGDGAVLPILHLNGYKIANPTVLARIGDDELAALLHRLRLQAVPRGGRRPGGGASAARRDPGHRLRRDRRDPATGPRGRRDRPAALADDRAAHPEGLDRPEGGRRPAGRGHLAGPSGAAVRRPRRRRAPGASWRSGCARTGRRSCSTRRAPARRGHRLAADGRAADEREPAHQRRPAPARPGAARLPRRTRVKARARPPKRPGYSAAGCAT